MESEYQEYRGHCIELSARDDEELRAHEEERELRIDDEPVRYGQLPDGLYYLQEYAYDWTDDLIDLARKFIDYRAAADEMRREAETR